MSTRATIERWLILFNDGDADAYVAKLTPAGTRLAYSSYLGASLHDSGADIDVGPDGAAFVIGTTDSPDFPTTPGALDRRLNGPTDAFVTKLLVGP